MKKKICFVVAIPSTAQSFLCDHIAALSKEYDIYLAGNIKSEDEVKTLTLTGWHHIDIERGISLKRDLKAVWQAYKYFKKMKFDAVHSVTPKAGLVTALAGWMAGVPHRTHIFTGQVWATSNGMMRWLLKSLDKVIVRLDNHILVDGKSQRAFLVKEGVLKEGEAKVFLHGSISGVNSLRFVPDTEARKNIRKQIGLKENTICYIFLGRLNHDKGIGELYEAYDRLAAERDDVFLLLVGRDEDGYIGKLPKYNHIKDGHNFHYYGITPAPEKVLNVGDVFVLPTYREGFGTSVLEAACIGLPSICSDAYGVQDAFIEGETGLCCRVGDAESLYQCMRKMCENPTMMKEMGKKSRERVLRDFSGAKLTECWVEFYRSLLQP
jgi:glycosyltransferase involved in cell wall biosynthesis